MDPESIRRGNEQYKETELALWTAFMERYPYSDLLITRPSEANEMNNCLFENNRIVESIQVSDNFPCFTLGKLDYIIDEQFRTSLNNNQYALAA